jgi:hypothetical protein
MSVPPPPQGRRYACPICADTFQNAWYRDEHFDAFHIVLDATLLPHDTPMASASPPPFPLVPKREQQAARPKAKVKSAYQ